MPDSKVLIVDDDNTARQFAVKALEADWQVLTAENGEEGIRLAQENIPGIILLDVEMPRMNGYMVCDQLKQDERTRDIPIIFLSSLSGVRDRLQGYEVGADDFLVKPYDKAELKARVSVLFRYHSQTETLAEQAQEASSTAMMALRGSGELGTAIQFIERSYQVHTLDELAQRFLNVTQSLGLRCSLLFQTSMGAVFYGDQGDPPPIEKDLMQTLHREEKRFIDFGARTQINYPRVALLVKNMPLDDPESYGRYKDFLPTMLGTTDAKVFTIETQEALKEQTQNLIFTFDNVRNTLMSISDSIEQNQHKLADTIRKNLEQIEGRIPLLGLEEDQEQFLTTALDNTLNDLSKSMVENEQVRQSLGMVPLLLKTVSDSQQALLDKVAQARPEEEALPPAADDAMDGDIELF